MSDSDRRSAISEIQKWDGYNHTWLEYANNIRLCLTEYKFKVKESSVRFSVLELAESFFRTIVREKINSTSELEKSKRIGSIINALKAEKIGLIEDSSTDVEDLTNLTSAKRPAKTTSLLSQFSELIKNIYSVTLEGTAKQVYTDTFSNDKDYLTVTNRLMQAFGRGFVQTACIPFYFVWSANLYTSWRGFVRTIENSGYLKYHSNSGPLLINRAKQGFNKSKLGREILMAMRITDKDQEYDWIQFCKTVETYINSRIREKVDNDLFENVGGCQTLPDYGLVKSEGLKSNESKQEDSIVSNKNHISAVVNKLSKKKQKFLITCGWCGKHHQHWKCPARSAKAWSQHTCRKCNGIGHPAAVCPSSKSILYVSADRNYGIFTTFLVEGPFGETTCKMPTAKNNDTYIIDSGAAVSVAPVSFCIHFPLDQSKKESYKLQSATGQKLKVYGTRNIDIKLGDLTIVITFVICQVTQPLISVTDLNQQGVEVRLNQTQPGLMINENFYPLLTDRFFFRMKLEYADHERIPILKDLTSLDNSLPTVKSEQNRQVNAVDSDHNLQKVKIGLENDPKFVELDTSVKPEKFVTLCPEQNRPRDKEVKKHNITHLPHASWCSHCVEGRMIKDRSLTVPKKKREKREGVVIQIDFFEYHELRILCMVETTSSYMFARVVETKEVVGTLDPKVQLIENFIRELGLKIVTLQSDSETTVQTICKLAAERFTFESNMKAISINTRVTSPHSSNSNGSVERGIRLLRDQLRVMFGDITHKFNIVFDPKTKFIPWLVRHACWIINRCIEKANNKTRYEDAFKRELKNVKLYAFLGPVIAVPDNRKKDKHTMKLYNKSPSGLYLGRVEHNNQHLIMTEDGNVIKAHTVRNTSMTIPQRLKILNKHEQQVSNYKLDQGILDETSINPKPDISKIVAARAAGSKTAWRSKTVEQKQNLKSMFAPNIVSTSHGTNSKLSNPQMVQSGSTDIKNNQTPEDTIDSKDVENLKFDILDKSMPSVVRDNDRNNKITFTVPGEESDKFDTYRKKALLKDLEKSNPPQKSSQIILEDATQRDDLVGYGVGTDGNLYNEHGDLIVDGYNQTKKCKEDLIRRRSKLPVIGDEERWKKARIEKIERMKRKLDDQMIKEPTMETLSKKAKLEIADSMYKQKNYVDSDHSKRLKISYITAENKSEQTLNSILFKQEYVDTGQIHKITNPTTYWIKQVDKWSDSVDFPEEELEKVENLKEHKIKIRNNDKISVNNIINNIDMTIDKTSIPGSDIRFFQNLFNNHIMAVTVLKRQVENSIYPQKWEEARNKEMESLRKFDVFEVVDRQEIPADHPDPIGCRWLYTLKDYPFDTYQKDNPEAEISARYKARLIVQGMCEQVDDTYSPTPTVESVRICLTLSVICDWVIKFTDVSTAFLHADVIGNKYVYPPDTENLGPTKVWKLKKALYGLKSAPKAWTQHLSKVLEKLGWKRSVLDECVFFKQNTDLKKDFPIEGMIIAYVDDLIVTGYDHVVSNFYTEFEKTCTCSEPEELKVGSDPIIFLGFAYTRELDYIKIDASDYTGKVLSAFSYADAKGRLTPGDPGKFVLDPKTRDSPRLSLKDHKKYRRLVGQCLWLSNVRRDIAYAVKELSKFVHQPTENDWKNGVHLLRYLAETKDECIFLKPDKSNLFEIEAYSDADLGGCRTSRKSTSGGCLSLNKSIVHTWAKQQQTIADSSAESEFIGLAQACKEILYMTEVFDELGIKLVKVPTLYVDNTSAIRMIVSNIKSRVKHLDRKQYWIRHYIQEDKITVRHKDGKLNLADLFTKFVEATTLKRLRPAVMGRERPPEVLD